MLDRSLMLAESSCRNSSDSIAARDSRTTTTGSTLWRWRLENITTPECLERPSNPIHRNYGHDPAPAGTGFTKIAHKNSITDSDLRDPLTTRVRACFARRRVHSCDEW